MNGGSRSLERLGVQKRPGRDITLCQKDLDLAVEVVIALATLLQEPEAFLRTALEDCVVETCDLPPSVRLHALSSF